MLPGFRTVVVGSFACLIHEFLTQYHGPEAVQYVAICSLFGDKFDVLVRAVWINLDVPQGINFVG